MLRCCKLLLRLRNNHGSQNLSYVHTSIVIRGPDSVSSFSLDVTVRSVHNASKSHLRDVPLGTRVRPTVYLSSLDHPSAYDSIPSDDRIEMGVDVDPLQADGTISPFVKKIKVSQLPLSNPGISQSHMVSGTPSVFCDSREPSQHDTQLSKPTGVAFYQSLSADSQCSVAPEDSSNAVIWLRGLISATTVFPTESVVVTLKSLLHSFGAKLVRSLDARQSGELLCLLGTISDDGSGGKYHSTWKNKGYDWSGLDVDGCWEEAVKVAEVREQLGHVFGERENFWSMRAYLRRLKLVDTSGM